MAALLKNNWKILLFSLLMLPVLLRLAFWQLDREVEKRELSVLYEQRLSQSTIAFDELGAGLIDQDLSFLPIRLQGFFENEKLFILDNRTVEGRAGYEVLAPFETTSGKVVFVNRGWLAQGLTRSDLPIIPVVEQEQILRANIYVPAGKPFMLGEESSFTGWPRVMQSVDIERMYEELGITEARQGLGFSLRLAENEPGVLVRHWPAISTTPEKHRGYAIQWFAMSLALMLLCCYSLVKSWREESAIVTPELNSGKRDNNE